MNNHIINIAQDEIDVNQTNIFSSLLPIAMKISASTLGFGGWRKSKKQQLKEDRLNKILLLNGEEPNVTLPNDEQFGLVSVQPMSSPSPNLCYVDFIYKSDEIQEHKEIIKLNCKKKLKYILKNKEQNKWMI